MMPAEQPRFRQWATSFIFLDPRKQVSQFFKPGDERGPGGYVMSANESSRKLSITTRPTSYFSVFRPTSNDALRMMIVGKATGKGLNIKGKSAKQGVLSGFVPLLQVLLAAPNCRSSERRTPSILMISLTRTTPQIHAEEHKKQLSSTPRSAVIDVYFQSEESCRTARVALALQLKQMLAKVRKAQRRVAEFGSGGIAVLKKVRRGSVPHVRPGSHPTAHKVRLSLSPGRGESSPAKLHTHQHPWTGRQRASA